MGQNQHYVPQYLLRRFASTPRSIAALHCHSGKLIAEASVRSQCARNNFYGSREVEALLADLDAKHATAIRNWADYVWNPTLPEPDPEHLLALWQVVVLQRSRTSLEVAKHANAREQFNSSLFRHFLSGTPDITRREDMIRAIDAGQVHVTTNPTAAVLTSVQMAIESNLLVSDLDFCFLRNQTDYPFILGDSPVVFTNDYCRNVKNRGVLGLQCPGLQITFPLDSETCLFMFDRERYRGRIIDHMALDVVMRSDVSAINALQLHHSENAVYFGDFSYADYVSNMLVAHKSQLRTPESKIDLDSPLLVDGGRLEGSIIHMFEPQVNYDYRPSFIECERVRQVDYVYRPRSPELRDEVRRRFERGNV